ncbi:TPA: restriction endonuclease subunit S, partial [Listeria monocytogenes]|nr:restriction endonuclease subunit S [Listeria monocytogenes]HBI6066618.1 restriction endonuclease subunit S [Listeria monocytogenes]
FDEEWYQRKLGEISDKVIEKNKESTYFETLTNSAEYGIISQREFFNKDISNEKNLNGYYIVRENDFVYNPRISNYAPVGPIKRNKLGRIGIVSPLYYVFRTFDTNQSFLEYYFDGTVWHNFMLLNGDSGARADRFAIKDSVLKEMPIPYSTLYEQEKISFFLDEITIIINLHQNKLKKLSSLKKAYLQNMFI